MVFEVQLFFAQKTKNPHRFEQVVIFVDSEIKTREHLDSFLEEITRISKIADLWLCNSGNSFWISADNPYEEIFFRFLREYECFPSSIDEHLFRNLENYERILLPKPIYKIHKMRVVNLDDTEEFYDVILDSKK